MFLRKKNYTASSSLSALAWKKFKRNKLAYFSLLFVCFTVLVAILGYLIVPDSTPDSNEQYLEIAAQKPGFSIQMLKMRKKIKEEKQNLFTTMVSGKKNNYILMPVYSYKFNGDEIIIEKYTGMTPNDGETAKYKLPEILFPVEKDQISLNKDQLTFIDISGNKQTTSIDELKKIIIKKNIIKKRFLLGTDRFGRDMLSRLIIGARVSLSVGFISIIISLIIGIFLGSLAGFFRGWVDNLIVWFINVVWSIPTLLLVIAITFALGKGFWQVFVAVGLTMWVDVARVVRGQILSIREKEFVEAARALGYKNSRIIFKHILPNVMGVVIVISAANFASAILTEAGLSFLGIGVQPPMPSWGTMIKEHYEFIILDSTFLPLLPGFAIMIMVLAFMVIGNGLRDALDVKIE